MAFGDDDGKEEDDAESTLLEGIRSYTVFEESPINSKYLGLQRKANSENRWNRTRVIIPKFRGSKVLKCYHINEYSLMSQLTYGKQLVSRQWWLKNRKRERNRENNTD